MFKLFLKNRKNSYHNTWWPISNGTSGMGLVEIVIGSTIITLAIAGMASVFSLYLNKTINLTDGIKGEFLAKEGVEALISMRNKSWVNIANIPINTTRYFVYGANGFATSTSNIYIDEKFERSFILEEVYRDVSSNIAGSGTLDNKSRKATVLVSWRKDEATTTRNLSVYLNDVFGN